MQIEPPHASLGQLYQLGLITAQELDEANSERDVDALYELDLLNQFQRNAAHAAAPDDRMFYTPWIAMRWLVVNDVLPTAQFEALEVHVREHGSELAREIMEASRLRHGHDRIAYKRPPAWKGALIVLGQILVMSAVYRLLTGGLQP